VIRVSYQARLSLIGDPSRASRLGSSCTTRRNGLELRWSRLFGQNFAVS
jgi:hypothetical protein